MMHLHRTFSNMFYAQEHLNMVLLVSRDGSTSSSIDAIHCMIKEANPTASLALPAQRVIRYRKRIAVGLDDDDEKCKRLRVDALFVPSTVGMRGEGESARERRTMDETIRIRVSSKRCCSNGSHPIKG
ncbi:hypothetical protein CC2G_004179 [Coprinopsis cinerea AmutBmut pab1-1]|nr:hypothetical protein CC2G_004179 [Coprinopsis cinerea AmutBmut pab1-1]